MKKTLVKILLTIWAIYPLINSCSNKSENVNGIVESSISQTSFEISNRDTLKINLGNFGDEEGATILKDSKNAKISLIYHQKNSNSLIYEYYPVDNFIGKDTVVLRLYQNSDGSLASSTSDKNIYIDIK